MNDALSIAVYYANKSFNLHPNYAYNLLRRYPAPLVERGDLHGMWYECLFDIALRFPEQCQEDKLFIVMAYRHLIKVLRSKNALKNLGPSDWDCQDEKKRQYYHDFLQYQELLDEENAEDV
jgi:hypothetical protein